MEPFFLFMEPFVKIEAGSRKRNVFFPPATMAGDCKRILRNANRQKNLAHRTSTIPIRASLQPQIEFLIWSLVEDKRSAFHCDLAIFDHVATSANSRHNLCSVRPGVRLIQCFQCMNFFIDFIDQLERPPARARQADHLGRETSPRQLAASGVPRRSKCGKLSTAIFQYRERV